MTFGLTKYYTDADMLEAFEAGEKYVSGLAHDYNEFMHKRYNIPLKKKFRLFYKLEDGSTISREVFAENTLQARAFNNTWFYIHNISASFEHAEEFK